MKKNKKMKPLFEKVKCVMPEHRETFISEYYFACRLVLKMHLDIETFLDSPDYDQQLKNCEEDQWSVKLNPADSKTFRIK
jgi:hypothetical protein